MLFDQKNLELQVAEKSTVQSALQERARGCIPHWCFIVTMIKEPLGENITHFLSEEAAYNEISEPVWGRVTARHSSR
jgi:hypothetical protein